MNTTFTGTKTIATVNSRIHAIGVLLSGKDGSISETKEMALELELGELHLWCDAQQHGVAIEENKSSCEGGV